MLMLLSHVIVYVADMKRSVAFYRDLLGFPVKMESPEWTELHTGRTTLALHIAAPGDRPTRLMPGDAHIGIEVVDLDKFYDEKKAKGITFNHFQDAAHDAGVRPQDGGDDRPRRACHLRHRRSALDNDGNITRGRDRGT